MTKITLKTHEEIAIEMYVTAHTTMIDLEIQNEYLKTATAKKARGNEKAKELRADNKKDIKVLKEKLEFVKEKYLKDCEIRG